jgi:transposase
MPDHACLPDDNAALKTLLLQRDSEVQQLRSTVSTLEPSIRVRALEIELLKRQTAKLMRMHVGRKSEKIDRKIEHSKSAWKT